MADLAADPTPAPAASPAPSRWRSADETATSPRSLSLDPTAGARPCEASPQDGDTQGEHEDGGQEERGDPDRGRVGAGRGRLADAIIAATTFVLAVLK